MSQSYNRAPGGIELQPVPHQRIMRHRTVASVMQEHHKAQNDYEYVYDYNYDYDYDYDYDNDCVYEYYHGDDCDCDCGCDSDCDYASGYNY